MKLSKGAFTEILKKCEKRFPAKIGTSMHDSSLWTEFCDKKPIEFTCDINGVHFILRVNSDGYAVYQSNSCSFFRIYSFKFEK